MTTPATSDQITQLQQQVAQLLQTQNAPVEVVVSPTGRNFPPTCRIGDYARVWSQADWHVYPILYREPMPASSQSFIDLCFNTSGVLTAIASGQQTVKAIASVLQLYNNEMIEIRMAVVDDFELQVYELSGTPRWNTRNWQARCTIFSSITDPDAEATTIAVIGQDRDAQFVAQNTKPVSLGHARMVFWGWRYVVGVEQTQQQIVALQNMGVNFKTMVAEGRIA